MLKKACEKTLALANPCTSFVICILCVNSWHCLIENMKRKGQIQAGILQFFPKRVSVSAGENELREIRERAAGDSGPEAGTGQGTSIPPLSGQKEYNLYCATVMSDKHERQPLLGHTMPGNQRTVCNINAPWRHGVAGILWHSCCHG
uniref:Uncharacterized protein n=1 Tax=Nothobranchius pienaari TaxID=704102 RepID=A0A1A8MJ67_9TELE